MNITEVTIRLEPNRPNPLIRGYASFVIDGGFRVTQLRIIQKPNGRYHLAMPSQEFDGPAGRPGTPTRQDADGEYHYRDVAFAINWQTRVAIERVVLDAYLRSEREGILFAIYDTRPVEIRKAVSA